MRWAIILLTLLGTVAHAQEATDTTALPENEWNATNYTQEDKVYNRSVWTFVDNPALAGFDRKLAVAYRYRMKNLKMGVPNKDGDLVLGFQQHEAFVDLPFGGPKQNWGMGLYYAYEKELQHTYHRVQMARSLRIQLVREHYFIVGFSFGMQFASLNWDALTFGDMIDPRTGFVYQTNEVVANTSNALLTIDAGFRYCWKRFSFDYAFHQGPQSTGGYTGLSYLQIANRLKAAYHFNVGDGVTVSPELVFNISNVAVATGGSTILSAYATIAYHDVAFGQLGITDLNKLSFKVGYQLKDFLVIQVGLSSYLDRTMDKIAGIALVEGGIRYQIKAWNR